MEKRRGSKKGTRAEGKKEAGGDRRFPKWQRLLPVLVIGAGWAAGIATMLFSFGRNGFWGEAWQSGGEIMVVTRESGSGTRSAFLDLFELQEISGDRRRTLLTPKAVTVNRSGSLLAAIAGNPYAVGYASFHDHLIGVRAVSINQVAPTREHIQDGSYPYVRPFFMAIQKKEQGNVGAAFLQYVLSEEGQRLAEEAGYLPVKRIGQVRKENTGEGVEEGQSESKAVSQKGGQEKISGQKLIIAGSSTIMPLAEVLAEGYQSMEVELQESDSGSGLTMLLQGNADVALLSRELTEQEKKQVIWAAVAMDALVILVNEQNPVESLTKEEIRRIFMGEEQVWNR